MIALWILGIVLVLLATVLLLRVSVQAAFGQELRVVAKIGPVPIQILPKPEKEKKSKEKTKKEEKAEKPKPKIKFEDVREAFPILFEALKKTLGKIRKRMRVEPLHVSVIFGGDDPARVAELYGWASSAMWTVMPPLEELIHIPNPHIHLGVDYNSFSTYAEGEVGVRFRVIDLLVIALTFGIPALKWYLQWQKKQPAPVAEKKTTTDNTEQV
ncbi:MAG: DUF2953 domain-containing protein [Oscillospiraceae bacterium]|nr:DUF2953 domain-containing protein [Oscillospiraceae bacterium]